MNPELTSVNSLEQYYESSQERRDAIARDVQDYLHWIEKNAGEVNKGRDLEAPRETIGTGFARMVSTPTW